MNEPMQVSVANGSKIKNFGTCQVIFKANGRFTTEPVIVVNNITNLANTQVLVDLGLILWTSLPLTTSPSRDVVKRFSGPF